MKENAFVDILLTMVNLRVVGSNPTSVLASGSSVGRAAGFKSRELVLFYKFEIDNIPPIK